MELTQSLAIVFVTALLVAIVTGLLLRTTFRSQPGTPEAADRLSALAAEADTLKLNKADLERRLAVEELKASRLLEIERVLADAEAKAERLQIAKATADAELAASKEGQTRLEAQTKDLRERLVASEQMVTLAQKNLADLKDAKASVDEALSARNEAVRRSEGEAGDLRIRLGSAESAAKASQDRITALLAEKAAAERAVIEKEAVIQGMKKADDERTARLDKATAELADVQRDSGDLRANLAALREALEQERKQSEEKIALLTAARADMTKEFKSLADEVMSRHGENFTKLNKEQIDGLLQPLKEKIGEFQHNIQVTHAESIKERATLSEQLRQITETGATMTKETKELTEALRGNTQTQGAWGEMILSSILERSGLRPDEEYFVQKGFSNDDGQRLRPDVIINLPGGQKVVVDSKVSLTAFERMVNATTEEERASHLQKHLTSLRSHINALASKDYHLAAGSMLDYVVMFVPIEGALAAALQADPGITTLAAESNVAITTPTTLMIALRTIANVWQVERRNRNAEDIADRAGKIYDKFVGFTSDMKAVGDSIDRARQSFDGAMGKLTSGRGNVVRQLEQLRAMGARASKSLPPALLEAAEGAADAEMAIDAPEIEAVLGAD